MRTRILTTALVAAQLLGAASASAFFEIDLRVRPGSANSDLASLVTSDTVTVDLFFSMSSEVYHEMQQLFIGVVSPDTVSYDTAASTALPLIYPHAYAPTYTSTGAQNGYILYASFGKGFSMLHALQEQPVVWPTPDPGTNQTNVNFSALNILVGPSLSSADEWLASIVFHIGSGFTGGELALRISGNGTLLMADDVIVEPGDVTLSAPLALSARVPEPAAVVLIALGALVVALAGRRS
jgi:hypothetical protein